MTCNIYNYHRDKKYRVLTCLHSFVTGQDLCLGKPLDDTLLKLIRKEVQQLSDTLDTHKEQNNRIDSTLGLLKTELDKAIDSLQEKQAGMEMTCKELLQRQEMIADELDTSNKEVGMCREMTQKVQSLCKSLEVKSAFMQQELDILTTTVNSMPRSDDSSEIVFDAPEKIKWFTGREEEFESLERCLPLKEHNKLKMAAICGLGGCGKSTLATHFAWKREQEYEGGVFWISMEDDRKFENSVNDLAFRLGIEANSFDFTLSKLLTRISKQQKSWLMVLDDVDQLHLSENMHTVLSGRWKRRAGGDILLTTRREPKEVYGSVDIDPSCCIELFSFSEEEAKEFLLVRCGCADTENELVLDDIDELICELGCLPLALEQAGAHIKALQCSIKDYLQAYRIQRLQLLSQHPRAKPSWEYESKNRLAVHTTWLLNFEYVKKSPLGELASIFLKASAFFASNEINEELVICEVLSTDQSFNLPLVKNQIVDILTKFSLFQRKSCRSLRLHRLVQEVIRNEMSIQETVTSMLTAVKLLYRAFRGCHSPDEIPSYITSSELEQPSAFITNKSLFYLWSKLATHASALQHHLKTLLYQQDIDREVKAVVLRYETSRVIYENAVHLSVHGHQVEAKEAERLAFSIFDSCPNAEGPMSKEDLTKLFPLVLPLNQMIKKTVVYSSRPPIECAKHAEDSSEHSRAIDDLRLQGNTFFKQGRFKEAVEAYTSALEVYEKGMRPDPRLLNNRATAYLKLSNYKNSLQDSEDYIEILPTCWKGYTRKALALKGLGLRDYASSTAAIAYNYNVTCCRRYEPFANVFKALDGRWEVVASSESLQRSMERTGKEFSERKIILLRNGQYDLHDTADIIEIALVALENRSDVTINCNNPLLRKKCFFHKIAFTANLSICVVPDADVEFHKCIFRNRTSDVMVVYIDRASAKFIECTVKDSKGSGIAVNGQNSSASLTKCEISGHGSADNAFAYGIRVFNKGSLLVSDSRIYGNVRGIWVDEARVGIPAKTVIITDCEIYDNKYEGVVAGGCKWVSHDFTVVIMRRNKIYHNGTIGIRVTFNINNILVENNKVFENLWWGVCVHNNAGGVYKTNEICNNKMGGIRFGYQAPGKPPCVVVNNYIHDNCGPALYEGLRYSENYSFPEELRECFWRGVFSEENVSFPNMVLAEVSSNHCVQNDNGQKSFKPAAVMTHCVFCFRRDLKLKPCKRCMTATYCGKNCQKLHWQKHQYTCKATGQRNTIEVEVAEGFPNDGSYHVNFNKSHSSLAPSGPDYYPPPPKDGSRFVVKIQTSETDEFGGLVTDSRGLLSDEQDPNKARMLLYDRSHHVHFRVSCKPQLFHLIMECGMMGKRMTFTKKLYCWAAFQDVKTLRIFTHEFPEVQEW